MAQRKDIRPTDLNIGSAQNRTVDTFGVETQGEVGAPSKEAQQAQSFSEFSNAVINTSANYAQQVKESKEKQDLLDINLKKNKLDEVAEQDLKTEKGRKYLKSLKTEELSRKGIGASQKSVENGDWIGLTEDQINDKISNQVATIVEEAEKRGITDKELLFSLSDTMNQSLFALKQDAKRIEDEYNTRESMNSFLNISSDDLDRFNKPITVDTTGKTQEEIIKERELKQGQKNTQLDNWFNFKTSEAIEMFGAEKGLEVMSNMISNEMVKGNLSLYEAALQNEEFSGVFKQNKQLTAQATALENKVTEAEQLAQIDYINKNQAAIEQGLINYGSVVEVYNNAKENGINLSPQQADSIYDYNVRIRSENFNKNQSMALYEKSLINDPAKSSKIFDDKFANPLQQIVLSNANVEDSTPQSRAIEVSRLATLMANDVISGKTSSEAPKMLKNGINQLLMGSATDPNSANGIQQEVYFNTASEIYQKNPSKLADMMSDAEYAEFIELNSLVQLGGFANLQEAKSAKDTDLAKNLLATEDVTYGSKEFLEKMTDKITKENLPVDQFTQDMVSGLVQNKMESGLSMKDSIDYAIDAVKNRTVEINGKSVLLPKNKDITSVTGVAATPDQYTGKNSLLTQSLQESRDAERVLKDINNKYGSDFDIKDIKGFTIIPKDKTKSGFTAMFVKDDILYGTYELQDTQTLYAQKVKEDNDIRAIEEEEDRQETKRRNKDTQGILDISKINEANTWVRQIISGEIIVDNEVVYEAVADGDTNKLISLYNDYLNNNSVSMSSVKATAYETENKNIAQQFGATVGVTAEKFRRNKEQTDKFTSSLLLKGLGLKEELELPENISVDIDADVEKSYITIEQSMADLKHNIESGAIAGKQPEGYKSDTIMNMKVSSKYNDIDMTSSINLYEEKYPEMTNSQLYNSERIFNYVRESRSEKVGKIAPLVFDIYINSTEDMKFVQNGKSKDLSKEQNRQTLRNIKKEYGQKLPLPDSWREILVDLENKETVYKSDVDLYRFIDDVFEIENKNVIVTRGDE